MALVLASFRELFVANRTIFACHCLLVGSKGVCLLVAGVGACSLGWLGNAGFGKVLGRFRFVE